MRKNACVLLVMCIAAAAACTPFYTANQLGASVRPAMPTDVKLDELYWNDKVIRNTACPDINGKYSVPGNRFSSRLFYNNVKHSKGVVGQNFKWLDVTITVKNLDEGLLIRGQTEIDEQTSQISFGDKFGCANGQYVFRYVYGYSGGGDTFRCTSLAYFETSWMLDENKNLIINTIQRNPCWIERGYRDSKTENVHRPLLLKRIGDVD